MFSNATVRMSLESFPLMRTSVQYMSPSPYLLCLARRQGKLAHQSDDRSLIKEGRVEQ